jgi:hypothetical protein
MDAHRIAKVQVSPAIGHSDDEEEEYQPEVTGADSSGGAELPDEPEQEMEPADTPNGDVQEVPEEAAGETMLDADEEPSGEAGEETSQDEESATVEEQPQESGETTDEGAEPGDDEAKQQKKTAG